MRARGEMHGRFARGGRGRCRGEMQGREMQGGDAREVQGREKPKGVQREGFKPLTLNPGGTSERRAQ